MIVETLVIDGYERVVHFTEKVFDAFIALHSTHLGPALGGCRIAHYESDDAALKDVLRLSKGMTLKNAVAGLDFGGGKCVVKADHAPDSEMLQQIGDAVEFFRGDYITAEDVGTTLENMQELSHYTRHVIASSTGDPSPWTSRGVMACIKTAAAIKNIRPAWTRANVYVQGLGKVGSELARLLNLEGFMVYADDLDKSRIPPYAIHYDGETAHRDIIDIYAPCAMGSVITAANVDLVGYKVICGSANNQLETDDLAERLQDRDILYCPDFLVNAGGVIAVSAEITGMQAEIAKRVDDLGAMLRHAIETARMVDVTPLEIANAAALARL